MTKPPEAYFPTDYRSGRAAFIEACEAADLGVTARVHPSAKGPDGKPLFIDVATIGAREAKTALLLISGTHGVEGYFGSGVETGLLREGLARRAPKSAKIIVLHALNPYGFAWNRRVNEDNADINRNFVDHAHPPMNAAYEMLSDFIAPKSISPVTMKKANARLRDYAREHGDFALQEAISAGQYSHPDGLYFGGAQTAWSAAMLKDVFVEELAHVKRLIVIDFHTGLGKSGAAEMITEDLPGSTAYARARAMWGGLVHSSEAGESLSAPLTGTIDAAVAQWMKGKELTFAALEVGTAPLRDVFLSLRKDNWLHTRATQGHHSTKAIKNAIRAAFYPDTAEWKRRVWDHAEEVVDAACAALA
jgi:predicted deacylase